MPIIWVMAEDMTTSSAEGQYHKASMAVEKKNYDYAIDILTHSVNIKPDFTKARQLLRIAQIKKYDENPPNIIVKTANGISSFLHISAAAISESKGENQKAISIYEKALRKDPKNVTALIRLGGSLKAEKLNGAAMVTLEVALKLSADNAAALGLLGDIYSDLGNYEKAKACYKKVLGLKPNDANAERGLKNLDALTTIDRL